MAKIPHIALTTIILLLLSACGREHNPYDLNLSPETRYRVAITIDDLPWDDSDQMTRKEMSDYFVRGITRAPIPGAVGFVIAGGVYDDSSEQILRDWTQAGAIIGNHTFTHIDLHESSVEDYIEEVEMAQSTLNEIVPPHFPNYFRYTYLHEGDTREKYDAFQNWMASQAYQEVPVTIQNHDYLFNSAYLRCLDEENAGEISELREYFLSSLEEQIAYNANLAHTLFDRDVPHILLLHMRTFTAEMFQRIVLRLKALGVEFISVEEALEDPIYINNPGFVSDSMGAPYLEKIRLHRNLDLQNVALIELPEIVSNFCPNESHSSNYEHRKYDQKHL